MAAVDGQVEALLLSDVCKYLLPNLGNVSNGSYFAPMIGVKKLWSPLTALRIECSGQAIQFGSAEPGDASRELEWLPRDSILSYRV